MYISKDIKHKLAFLVLMVVGTTQMIGDVLHIPSLKAVAAATGSSPAPKVFTAQQGFETYSAKFFIDWQDATGQKRSLEVTPSVYRGIRGPYNRRNAYGATLSYAPVLYGNPATRSMFETVVHYAFCGEAPLLRELGVIEKDPIEEIRVRIEPRQKLAPDHNWKLNYEVDCE